MSNNTTATKLHLEMVVEEKTFVNPQGEVIDYQTLTAEIEGTPIRFTVKKEDKTLFQFLLARANKK